MFYLISGYYVSHQRRVEYPSENDAHETQYSALSTLGSSPPEDHLTHSHLTAGNSTAGCITRSAVLHNPSKLSFLAVSRLAQAISLLQGFFIRSNQFQQLGLC